MALALFATESPTISDGLESKSGNFFLLVMTSSILPTCFLLAGSSLSSTLINSLFVVLPPIVFNAALDALFVIISPSEFSAFVRVSMFGFPAAISLFNKAFLPAALFIIFLGILLFGIAARIVDTGVVLSIGGNTPRVSPIAPTISCPDSPFGA